MSFQGNKLVNEGENPFKETSFVSHAEQNVTRQKERQKKNPSANCIEVSWDGKEKLRKISIGNLFPSEIHFLIDEPSSSPLVFVEQ